MSREIRFGLVLNRAEKEALDGVAEVEGGLSQAATLRRLIRQAACEHGLWPPKEGRGGQPGNERLGGRQS